MLTNCVTACAAMAAALALSPAARAADFSLMDAPVFLATEPAEPVKEAPAAPVEEKPNIHGFLNVPFKTAYVTPRGLVVENQGVVIQPVVGLVFPIGDIGPMKGFTIVTGVWNCITSHQDDPNVQDWNEMDFVFSMGTTVANNISLALTYCPFYSPTGAFQTEHNMDLKIGFVDAPLWGKSGFSLNPYVDLWWAMSGDSTVVLGSKGATGYVELGIVPTFKFGADTKYPLTVTIPTYFSVGPEEYWGDPDEGGGQPDGNFGVFSTAVNVGVPLTFIPARYGYWHADAGISYFYLINDTLRQAGTIVSGNDDENVFVGAVGVGVNF